MKNLLAVSFALILTISYLLLATQWQFEPQPTSAVQQASTHQPTPTPSPSPTARPRPHHTPTPVPLPTAVPTSLPTNGDFSNGSDGWTIETFIGCGSHSEVRFLGQDGPNSNVVQFIAEGNGGCYTDAKLLQILDIEVPANSQMVVSADVKSVHSAVRGPCGDTGSEMPLHIQLEYVTDQEQDRRILWSFTHKTGGTCGIRNGWRDDRYSSDFDNEYYANITVPHNEWYSFTSEDAKAIDPAMARLTWLGILGNGWDRDSRIDNIHLSMTTPTRAPTAVDDHGDTPSGSTLIPVSSEWYGSIEDGDDVDFFSFRASGGHEYVIETHLDSNPDTVLALYDPAGDVIDHHDDSGSGGGERMVWVAPSTDTYYIEVMGYEGATGTYFLTLIEVATPAPTAAPARVADDHGDTPSGSTLIPVSSEWYGSIEDGDDVDFFSFRASGGHEYVIETHLDSNPDTVLALYDPAGDVIDHHDDSGSGGGERMVWVAPSTDTYYIEVMGYEGATGTYFLTLIEVAIGSSRQGGELRLALGEEPFPYSFTPIENLFGGAAQINSLIFSRLWRVGDSGVEPDLVEWWNASADSREWTLGLRQDARFHDGRPVTAHDVAYSFEAMQRYLPSFAELLVIDDHTLRISFENPTDFVFLIARFDTAIVVPRGMLDLPINSFTNLVGSGPFVPDEYEKDSFLFLNPNPPMGGVKAGKLG